MNRVEVEWVDSKHVASEWLMLDEVKEEELAPQSIRTVGFLFRDVVDFVVVMASDGGDQVSEGISIPRRAVSRITELVEKEPLSAVA